MRYVVEQWAAEYGSPVGGDALGESQAAVDVSQELPADAWTPLRPAAGTTVPDEVAFVDGVRRVEARVWLTGPDGRARQGLCASYAAGVVRCNGDATVVDAQVRRGLFAGGDGLQPIETRHGRFAVHPVADATPDGLSLALQAAMGDLEHHVSTTVDDGTLLVVDGPLRERRLMNHAVGYVKTHHVAYLPAVVSDIIGDLAPGERTPVILVGDRFRRWSWYLRLPEARARAARSDEGAARAGSTGSWAHSPFSPSSITHPWAGIVRCEASPDRAIDDVRAVADVTAVLLPRFASAPHKDKRAPQNLIPIGGLERELRRRLGDPALLYRALRSAS